MKTPLKLLLAAALLTGSTALAAVAANPATASVNYIKPDKFTDFRTSSITTKSDQDGLAAELTARIKSAAAGALPPGYALTINFSDIDMAGDFEPWRGARFMDTRIVRSIYPPRLTFAYSVADPEGKIVASGDKKLTDLTFDMNIYPINSDVTRVENDMMRNFISDLARDIKAGKH